MTVKILRDDLIEIGNPQERLIYGMEASDLVEVIQFRLKESLKP